MLMEMTGYDDIHYGLKDDRMVGLNIDFKFQHIAQYKELTDLNGKSFDLSDSGQVNAVELVFNSWQERGDDDVTCRMTVERGTLTFSKVMLLRIDEEDEEAIVAGTFEIYGTPDKRRDGRGNWYRLHFAFLLFASAARSARLAGLTSRRCR